MGSRDTLDTAWRGGSDGAVCYIQGGLQGRDKSYGSGMRKRWHVHTHAVQPRAERCYDAHTACAAGRIRSGRLAVFLSYAPVRNNGVLSADHGHIHGDNHAARQMVHRRGGIRRDERAVL